MSVGPLTSLLASAAGVSLAQQEKDVERTQTEKSAQNRHRDTQIKADRAAGIGETDGDNHETTDRDADGRRPWELDAGADRSAESGIEEGQPKSRQSRDASGDSGQTLDLTG